MAWVKTKINIGRYLAKNRPRVKDVFIVIQTCEKTLDERRQALQAYSKAYYDLTDAEQKLVGEYRITGTWRPRYAYRKENVRAVHDAVSRMQEIGAWSEHQCRQYRACLPVV